MKSEVMFRFAPITGGTAVDTCTGFKILVKTRFWHKHDINNFSLRK